ncbi:fungal hydrophobin-domain-containing protein [Crucibulum laeve]|uniref:Hydrophobin n=1 Tax=Crucibulum laeve TaxID=68775 RepID=A0A5C3LLD2_9AGAR|nr:fungal hydrophobin-domain-containing protein [Crucibulum laeve]
MFACTSSFFALSILALPILAAAIAVPRTTPPTTPASQCNTGDLQCCNSTEDSSNLSEGLLGTLGGLGINVSSITGLVGATCSPITAIGIGGNSCNSQAVCCSNNSFNGLVAIGCTPVNINL